MNIVVLAPGLSVTSSWTVLFSSLSLASDSACRIRCRILACGCTSSGAKQLNKLSWFLYPLLCSLALLLLVPGSTPESKQFVWDYKTAEVLVSVPVALFSCSSLACTGVHTRIETICLWFCLWTTKLYHRSCFWTIKLHHHSSWSAISVTFVTSIAHRRCMSSLWLSPPPLYTCVLPSFFWWSCSYSYLPCTYLLCSWTIKLYHLIIISHISSS